MEGLLLRIARCPNIAAARCSSSHPCHRIVTSQSAAEESFQLPEPWNGRLDSAPLLFVSSNPAIGIGGEQPRSTWTDGDIGDFFMNRFSGGRKPWTIKGNKALLSDGTHGDANAFWSGIRQRAMELFERDVEAGRDYALTEIVRCKSLHEFGVREAAEECVSRYLMATVEASVASVIVTLGKVADVYIRRIAKFEGTMSGPVIVGGRERVIASLPHPNARMKRSFGDRHSAANLALLRQRLKEASHAAENRV